MPGIPQEIFSDWIQPGILVGVIALFLGAFRGLRADLKSEIQASEARQQASEARQQKQMDELKKDFKESEARQQKQMEELKKDFKDSEVRHSDALKASEARQKEQIDELKKANEVLAGKMDQLLDAFRAAQA